MKRLHVFSNLATSLDGKIATPSRELYPLGTPLDRRRMQELRAQSDVVLFGASSLRAFRLPCTVSGPLARKLKRQPANAVLSSAMEGISPDWPFFKRSGFHRILLVGADATPRQLKPFERSCEIIQLPRIEVAARAITAKKTAKSSGRGVRRPGDGANVARDALRELVMRGYSRVLVEGGGQVMWDFVRDDLIDEYHVTLTPKLIGGIDSPTLVDGAGLEPADVLNLKLKKVKRVGDELYLTYCKSGRRG